MYVGFFKEKTLYFTRAKNWFLKNWPHSYSIIFQVLYLSFFWLGEKKFIVCCNSKEEFFLEAVRDKNFDFFSLSLAKNFSWKVACNWEIGENSCIFVSIIKNSQIFFEEKEKKTHSQYFTISSREGVEHLRQ
jgi:hypothetical protein